MQGKHSHIYHTWSQLPIFWKYHALAKKSVWGHMMEFPKRMFSKPLSSTAWLKSSKKQHRGITIEGQSYVEDALLSIYRHSSPWQGMTVTHVCGFVGSLTGSRCVPTHQALVVWQHDDDLCVVIPDHPPEIFRRVRQRVLGYNEFIASVVALRWGRGRSSDYGCYR